MSAHDHNHDHDHGHGSACCGGGGEGKRNILTIVAAAVLVLVFAGYMVMFKVEVGTAGVVKTFGAVTRVEKTPGAYVKWPWPIQSVQAMDLRLRLIPMSGTEILTADEKNILVVMEVGWQITDPEAYISKFQNDFAARESLMQSLRDARERAIKSVNLLDILSTSPEQAANYKAFERNIQETVQGSLKANGYGMDVPFLKVTAIRLPATVTQMVLERMKNERQRVSTEIRAKGDSEAAMIRQTAETERSMRLSTANADAIRIRGQGDAAMLKHYEVFGRTPVTAWLAEFLRTLEAFKAAMKPGTTVVIPLDTPPFNTILQRRDGDAEPSH